MEQALNSILFFKSITEICFRYKQGLLMCDLKCLYLNSFALALSLLLPFTEQSSQENVGMIRVNLCFTLHL